MGRIILRRLALTPIVLIGVAVVVFLATEVIPVDTVALYMGEEPPTPQVRAEIIHKLGLDQSFWIRIGKYFDRLIHGDLGVSTKYNLPVREMVGNALVASLELVLCGALIAILITVTVGIICTRYRGRWPDVLGRGLAMTGMSVPPFFLAILGIIVFGIHLGWLPISGRGSPPDLAHLVMPSLVLGLREAGSSARILRAGMIDALSEDYVRSARGRGIGRRSILINSALRNALLPTVTDLAVSMTEMAGSLVLIEIVFSWPGIGNLLYNGIINNDGPLITGTVLVMVAYAVLVNLVTDVLYAVIDPRMG